MDYTRASNIKPLHHFANSQFALRNYCEFAISVCNTTVRIRQVVRTLNAQFCCVPCSVFLDGLGSQYYFSPLLERLFCRSLGLTLPEQSKFRALIAAYQTAYHCREPEYSGQPKSRSGFQPATDAGLALRGFKIRPIQS